MKNSCSKNFPSGLLFEDEFCHKRRGRLISSKSVPSDYASIENDNNNYHSQSFLPFEEEFAYQRPTSEVLYVDFSKSIHGKFKSHSNSIKNSISNCNYITNNSDNSVLNEVYEGIFSNFSNENNTDAITICNQPVIYVAVQWCPKQRIGLHEIYIPNRYDKV